jgi:uncharacterized protein (DUF2267 family)
VLRAYLHAVRDRLMVNEAAQLAAAAGADPRIYYEDARPEPSQVPHGRRVLDRVAGEAQLSGETQTSYACSAAARVLRRHISEGEIDDVVSLFPEEMRPVLAG